MGTNEVALPFRIKSLDNQVKRLLDRTAIDHNDANLTGMQYAVLGFISNTVDLRDVFLRDIEVEFHIRRSTASEMVIQLEKRGYIERVAVPDDARMKRIILTDKARKIEKMAEENMNHLHEKLTQGISVDEMEQFNQTLKKIFDNAIS